MLNSNDVISQSGIVFGTSGARGLVADFNHKVCAAFAHAFLAVVSGKYQFDTVAIAIDNRPSSYEIAQACAAAIGQHGYRVEYHGVVPTPALAFYAMQNRYPCIMVTGSHIPFDRNGLKFYTPDGEITKDDELAILNVCHPFSEVDVFPPLDVNHSAASTYLSRYTSLYNKDFLIGKRIGIYEHSSAGRDLYSRLFSQLGAEVVSLGRSDKFVPIDTEAVSDGDRALATHWSSEYKLDAIFSTDGDGDRPLVADEMGNWLCGDILGLLASRALNIEAVAIPVSCNTANELSGTFRQVVRTKIGSPYVIAALDELKKAFKMVSGYEANGGFLLASDIKVNGQKLASLPTRDAVLPAVMLLSLARECNISDLVKQMPQRFTCSDRLQNFPVEKSREIIHRALLAPQAFLTSLGIQEQENVISDTTDGARFVLSNGDVIHLRPSGNAPELRCYTEAASEEEAKRYLRTVLGRIMSL